MSISINKWFALPRESFKIWPESWISNYRCLIFDFIHSFGRIWYGYGELHGALVTPKKGNEDSPSVWQNSYDLFGPYHSKRNWILRYVIHCGSLWYLVYIGLWYVGDASKVFMLANHALTRRYLRSTGQLVGRRQAFFQDVQHCFPILLPCCGSKKKRTTQSRFSPCMLADALQFQWKGSQCMECFPHPTAGPARHDIFEDTMGMLEFDEGKPWAGNQ